MSEKAGQESVNITPEPLVEISGAEIANDGNIILSDVDITICKGEFVYLLGKVGSGKSSIIKTLIAELPLKKGEANVAGYNLRKIKRRHIPFLRRKLGVIFQDFQLLMDRTVEDNLLFVLEATGWKKRSKMVARAMEVLQMVGLAHKAGKMPHQLSGGEQQRVAIARAFLNNPQVILADEPTGNLDEETASDIMNLFMQIHTEQHPAVLMVTHNRELYRRYPGRVLICEGGSVREMEQEIEFDMHLLSASGAPLPDNSVAGVAPSGNSLPDSSVAGGAHSGNSVVDGSLSSGSSSDASVVGVAPSDAPSQECPAAEPPAENISVAESSPEDFSVAESSPKDFSVTSGAPEDISIAASFPEELNVAESPAEELNGDANCGELTADAETDFELLADCGDAEAPEVADIQIEAEPEVSESESRTSD